MNALRRNTWFQHGAQHHRQIYSDVRGSGNEHCQPIGWILKSVATSEFYVFAIRGLFPVMYITRQCYVQPEAFASVVPVFTGHLTRSSVIRSAPAILIRTMFE